MSYTVECLVKESHRKIMKKLNQEEHSEKRISSSEEGLNSLSKGEWAGGESQTEMIQDQVKLVCQGTTIWKTGIFLRRRIEFFTRGWVGWRWRGVTQEFRSGE